MAPISGELFQQALRDSADMPPWLRDALERGPRGAGFGIGTLFSFLLMLILMTTLGMLGGIFGALMFRKNQAPVIPPPIPQ